MKRTLLALTTVIFALSGTVLHSGDAEAKRLGGGSSSGMKRDSTVMKRDATPAAPAAPTQSALPAKPAGAPAAAPASGMSRWLGPIAGIAAGLGIAALLSHFGLGEGMANMLVILLAVGALFFVIRWFMRRNGPQPNRPQPTGVEYAGVSRFAGNGRVEPKRFEAEQPAGAASAAGVAAAATTTAATTTGATIPAGFDVEGFLRQAKLNYIRLQAANDRGDMDDIKQFTAPELFAEIQMQFAERGRTPQETDVQTLEAQLLDVSEEAGRYVASVRFHGQIREAAGGPVEALDEVWHLTKPSSGGTGWVVAGIQQYV